MRLLKTFRFVTALVLVGSAVSCNSLLEVEAKNNITGDIFKNEASIQQALNGAYFNLAGIYDGGDGGELLGGDFLMIPSLLIFESIFEVSWDDINGATYSDFTERNILATNVRVENNWRRAYETINTLNSILLNIDNVEDAGARDRIAGEALAMRGILYFEMVRLWGPQYSTVGAGTTDQLAIPLLLEPVEAPGDAPARNTVGEVYAQVIEDLTEAAAFLEPLGTNGTSLSYYTCEGYLMRVAMQTGNFADAIEHADNILNAGEFSLATTPQDAFNNTMNSTEDIFAIQQNAAYNAGNISTGTGLVNFYSSLNGQGLGAMRVSPFYLNNLFGDFDYSPEFSENDLRGTVDTGVGSSSTADNISAAFYTNLLNDITVSPSKYMANDRVIPIIRLAEVILSRAEARAFLSPVTVDLVALDDYNDIRERAGLTRLDASEFFIGIDLYDSILVERRREFLYEGILYHDMKRRNESINGVPLSDPRFILPIPQSELNAGME